MALCRKQIVVDQSHVGNSFIVDAGCREPTGMIAAHHLIGTLHSISIIHERNRNDGYMQGQTLGDHYHCQSGLRSADIPPLTNRSEAAVWRIRMEKENNTAYHLSADGKAIA